MFTIYADSRVSNTDLQNYKLFLQKYNIDYTVKNVSNYFDEFDKADIPDEIADIETILSVADYDLDKTAYHIIITWYSIFDSICKNNNIADIQEIKNSEYWFINKLRDSYPIEATITDALVEVSHEKIWNLFEIKHVRLLDYPSPAVDVIIEKVYDTIYDKIIAKIDELVEPYIQYFCDEKIKQLQQLKLIPERVQALSTFATENKININSVIEK